MPWSLREKAFCVRLYFSSNSYKFISNAFKNEFLTNNSPSNNRKHGWVNKFTEYGSVENLNRKVENRTQSGRSASTRTVQNIDAARESVVQDPAQRSTHRTHVIMSSKIGKL